MNCTRHRGRTQQLARGAFWKQEVKSLVEAVFAAATPRLESHPLQHKLLSQRQMSGIWASCSKPMIVALAIAGSAQQNINHVVDSPLPQTGLPKVAIID